MTTTCAFCPAEIGPDEPHEVVALVRGEPVLACFDCAVQVETGEPLIARREDT